MEIQGLNSQNIQNEVEIKVLKDQIDQRKDFAKKILDMGSEVTQTINSLHVNSAAPGHIDTYA